MALFSNSVAPAKWCKTDDIKHNKTTNHFITEAIHQRQREEYDRGELDVYRDPLLGSTIFVSEGDGDEVSVANQNDNTN